MALRIWMAAALAVTGCAGDNLDATDDRRGGDSATMATGDSAGGDTSVGDTSVGDTVGGDTVGGDTVAGDDAVAVGDTVSGCVGNLDGSITMAEMRAVPGTVESYVANSDVTIDSVGTMAAGVRQWDLSAAIAGDAVVDNTLVPVDQTWFASDFPNATYALPLVGGDSLMGVYQVAGANILLQGFASQSPATPATLTTYGASITAFATPLSVGNSWQSSATLSGYSPLGIIVYADVFDANVDAEGVLLTPAGPLDVIRVNMQLTRTWGIIVTTQRYHYYVAECLGIVAAVASDINETAAEFSFAAELLRLAP